MNCCLKSGIHELSPNSQVHNQIFHRIAKLSSIDFPDQGEDGFRKLGCVRRCLEIMFPCRFCLLLAFLINWGTGSVCKGFLPSFTVLGNGFPRNLFPFVVPDLSLRIVGVFWIFFFLMRRVSLAAFFMLHFSILTPMLAQSSSVRALTYTPKSEAVAPRYTWEEGTTAQSPSRCSDVLPPSRMSSANSVLALEPSLPPSSCRRARRRDPGKAKDSTFQGSSSCFPGKPDCIFPTVKPWENQKTLYLAPRSINKDVSLDDEWRSIDQDWQCCRIVKKVKP